MPSTSSMSPSWLINPLSLRTTLLGLLMLGMMAGVQGQIARGGIMTPFPGLYRQQQSDAAPQRPATPRDSLPTQQTDPPATASQGLTEGEGSCDCPTSPPPCRSAINQRREG